MEGEAGVGWFNILLKNGRINRGELINFQFITEKSTPTNLWMLGGGEFLKMRRDAY